MIITIDGPVATGKSTIAKKLAESVGFIFFDTGAMYRAVTYAIIKNQIDLKKLDELEAFLKKFEFGIKVLKGNKRYFLKDEDITDQIRLEEITSKVSEISAVKLVRERLVEIQRAFAEGVNAVFEGRDMGTTVFPNATLKIFLTGRPEVRAKRRFDEIQSKYPGEFKELTLEKCLEEITQRDTYDSNRDISPLKKAHDALELDTSDLTVDEIVFKILEYKDTLKTRRSRSH